MRLIQITKAAELTGVTAQTIKNWIDKGILDVKCVGKARYVDADTLEALGDTIQEVEATRKALEAERSRLDAESLELRKMRTSTRYEKFKLRTLAYSTASAVYAGFFEVIVGLLYSYKCINKREAEVLSRILRGDDIIVICDDLDLTKERIRQIAMKAIRKSKELETIKPLLDDAWKKDAYIGELEKQLERLKHEKGMQEKVQLEQYIADHLRNDPTFLLYTKKLVDDDLHLSVRALNVLHNRKIRGEEIDTLGKLASCQKSDLLKLRNLGKLTLMELDALLERFGLQWGSGIEKYYKAKRKQLKAQWCEEHGIENNITED